MTATQPPPAPETAATAAPLTKPTKGDIPYGIPAEQARLVTSPAPNRGFPRFGPRREIIGKEYGRSSVIEAL